MAYKPVNQIKRRHVSLQILGMIEKHKKRFCFANLETSNISDSGGGGRLVNAFHWVIRRGFLPSSDYQQKNSKTCLDLNKSSKLIPLREKTQILPRQI